MEFEFICCSCGHCYDKIDLCEMVDGFLDNIECVECGHDIFNINLKL